MASQRDNLQELVARVQALAPSLRVGLSASDLDGLALQGSMVRELGEMIVTRASDAAADLLEGEDNE